ncbi:Ribosomal RNA small subunit methyltransferase H [bioreactor metagenome]|uniref:Ribosomal RNA small subunit methyltransferase H n=1 Tax=bioreactor metagenome TaxID=1076179 RepID=A0A645GGD6_9ZZZZ
MDTRAAFSAYTVVNEYSEAALVKLLFEYGEEKFARRIAAAIVASRPVKTTLELSEIVKNAIPAPARRTGGNPAKRTFQAIRIEVNGELSGLEKALESAVALLGSGGRIAVITFHSLEDRIVKSTFKRLEDPCTCPPKAPMCVCGKKPVIKTITRKPETASEQEAAFNPRSHSAKLRVAQKL